MRITVPFVYRLDVASDGGLIGNGVIDGLDIDVDEVSSDEAPKATTYCDLSGSDIAMRGVRVRNERFYALGHATPRRARFLHRKPSGTLPPTEMLRYLDLNGGYRGQRALADLAAWYGKPEGSPRFCVPATAEDKNAASDRPHGEAALRSAAKGLLLVDGWLHYEIREPFVAVSSAGQTSIRNDFDMRDDPYRFRNLNDDLARFGLTEANRAEEFAIMAVPGRGPAARRYDQLSVHDAGAFRFDAASSLATRIAYDLVANTRQHVGYLRDNHIGCWLDLRDEMERAVQGQADVQRILETATSCIEQGVYRDTTGRVRREIGWLSSMIEERDLAAISLARNLSP